MRFAVILFILALCMAGCARQAPQVPDEGEKATDARSLTHISETNILKLGMHESEASQILGPPARRESGFKNGYRLWYELYDPRNGMMPSNYLVSTDNNGFVTFISSGGSSSTCPCPCP
ncbi:MAG: outer membrane protein assembly factor BamE [Desulfuromonas sp.]|nr:outer membrane protein assembly factor BamE [Desulfuromonas sp.]